MDDAVQHHVHVLHQLSQQLSQGAQLSTLPPSSFDALRVALSNVLAAVRHDPRAPQARRVIRQALPCLALVSRQPCRPEPRFAAVRNASLRALLFFYAYCDRGCDDLVLPAVKHVATRLHVQDLQTLMVSLAQIGVASKSEPLISSIFRSSPRYDRFVNVLRAILHGSVESDIDEFITPAACINVVNILSTACSLQYFDSGAHSAAFVDALLVVCESHVTHTNDNRKRPNRMFFLAVSAALLRFINMYSARKLTSHSLYHYVIQFIHQVLQRLEQPVSTLAFSHEDHITFNCLHRTSISIILIISSLSSIAVKTLSSSHIQLIRRSIQTCMQASLHKHHVRTAAPSADATGTFHDQMCLTISKHSTTLATAYADFIQQERCFQTSIHFFTTLLSTAPSSQSLRRFIYTVIANTNVTSDVAVAYVGVLSLINGDNPLSQRAVMHTLTSLVADDHNATEALVHLICTILVNKTSATNSNRRLLFLSAFLSLVLNKRRTTSASLHSSKHVLNEDMENVWAIFAREMVAVIDSDPKLEPIISAALECLSELVKQEDVSTKLAAEYLRDTLTKLLIEKYLFRDIPITMRKRVLHVVLFLDAITATANNGQAFEELLTTLIESASKVGAQADRMIGILLLRCLTRCDEKVVSVALDKMTSFIGTNRHRKETFLPLVRAAVLGLDTGKKDACVVWMMRLFGDMTQQQFRSTSSPVAVRTNMRVAKL